MHTDAEKTHASIIRSMCDLPDFLWTPLFLSVSLLVVFYIVYILYSCNSTTLSCVKRFRSARKRLEEMSKELRAKTRWTRPTESWPLVFGLEILHIRKGEQPQTHQVFMALRWVITSLPHKHVCPLALGAFPAMAVQLSDNLDPCRLHTEASRQQAGLICGQASPQSPDDLYHTFPQCFALSRQFSRARWWMGGGGWAGSILE